MVWFINKHMEMKNYKYIEQDIVFQKTIIFIYCQNNHYNGPIIYSLWGAGVSVFVVDRTIMSKKVFDEVKAAIQEAETINETCYYRPIGLAIVMAVDQTIELDERVDLIILKGVTCVDDLKKFKNLDHRFSTTPILLHFSNLCLDKIPQLIKVSDGILLDLQPEQLLLDNCPRALDFCEIHQKPAVFFKREFTHEFSVIPQNNRRILETAFHLTGSHLHGILIEDTDINGPEACIRALVSSLGSIEGMKNVDTTYYGFSPKLKSPLTPPFVVALAASLAALECGASVIMVLTASGRSARWLACARPPCHVLAISTRPSAVRQMHMYRKILPLLYKGTRAGSWLEECSSRVHFGTSFMLKIGLVSNGAKLVVLAPSEDGCGYCDAFQIVSVPHKCFE